MRSRLEFSGLRDEPVSGVSRAAMIRARRLLSASARPVVELTGASMDCDVLVSLAEGRASIALGETARSAVQASRAVIDGVLERDEVVYGINTGFGLFSNVIVPNHQLVELQENLIRSHSAGVGEPLTPERTRMLLALRINVLAKGHSGIRTETVDQLIAAFNADCLSIVPEKGTVGASGDLAPLAHLALGMMGEGEMWTNVGSGPSKAESEWKRMPAAEALAAKGLKGVQLGPKEGLAMINGTQLIASLGAEAVVRSANVAVCADIACALSLEVLRGTVKAMHPSIHNSRPHRGQKLVASRIRALLQPEDPSELASSHRMCGRVQDAYSLRCAPQVHGVVNDTIDFVRTTLDTELNSATDNPMVFVGTFDEAQGRTKSADGFGLKTRHLTKGTINANSGRVSDREAARIAEESLPQKALEEMSVEETRAEVERLQRVIDVASTNGWSRDGGAAGAGMVVQEPAGSKLPSDIHFESSDGYVLSGGNFHGEYPAKMLDFLAIGVHELAAISERRLERLCNPTLSGLPGFLVEDGGLHSGFMIAHCTAAALASENKVLCHPSSIDSLSTSAAKEDHVSMGGFAARKALLVVENVENVVAIEILAACQVRPRSLPACAFFSLFLSI